MYKFKYQIGLLDLIGQVRLSKSLEGVAKFEMEDVKFF